MPNRKHFLDFMPCFAKDLGRIKILFHIRVTASFKKICQNIDKTGLSKVRFYGRLSVSFMKITLKMKGLQVIVHELFPMSHTNV